MLHNHQGNLVQVGHRHRKPPPWLRRAVRERDGYRCQFPACHSRRTDIHHIVYWAAGGQTKLSNLILLCQAHHTIVHARGYQITHAASSGFTFTRPDHATMPGSPQLSAPAGGISNCHDAAITPDTIIPAGLGDKLDLHLTIWACFANARIAAERELAVASEQAREHAS